MLLAICYYYVLTIVCDLLLGIRFNGQSVHNASESVSLQSFHNILQNVCYVQLQTVSQSVSIGCGLVCDLIITSGKYDIVSLESL